MIIIIMIIIIIIMIIMIIMIIIIMIIIMIKTDNNNCHSSSAISNLKCLKALFQKLWRESYCDCMHSLFFIQVYKGSRKKNGLKLINNNKGIISFGISFAAAYSLVLSLC